jgi:hypothetical protein
MDSGGGTENNLGHGPRLSQREYERRIAELYSGLPAVPSKEEEIRLRRRELDLTIDYRLGQDFPRERREALWEIQRRVERKRLQLGLHWLAHFISSKWLYNRANKVAKFVVDEYAKVLTKEELRAYFGPEDSEQPTLPVDGL